MAKHSNRSARILNLAVLTGMAAGLIVLVGLLSAGGVVLGQEEVPSSVDSLPAHVAASEAVRSTTLTATSSYTYYFPIIFRNYVAPVWTSLGPQGVKIRGLVVDPQTPNTLYIGTVEHGICRSTDGGTTWEEINEGLPTDPTANALAIDPITPTNLYAGVVYFPNFYKSVDGGNGWQGGGGLHWRVVTLAVDPVSPTVLYAGTGQFEASGGVAYKSQDAGESWVQILPGLTNARIIVVDPVTSTIVYAQTGSSGLIKSVDGGESWTPVQDGLGDDLGWVHDIAIDPDDHNVLYTATADEVLRSPDGGDHWIEIGNGLPGGPIYGLTFAPTMSGTVYIGIRTPECTTPTCGGTVYKSTNGGDDWTIIGRIISGNKIQVMAVDPFNPQVLYIGTDGDGVWRYGPPLGSASGN